jgi:hypothetical protein
MNRYFKIVVLLILPFLAFGQKFRSEIQDYNSVVNLRNETLAPKKNDKAFIQTTKHLYSYDWGNTTSSDDGLKYIVQTSGLYRWVCLNCHLRVELSQDSILLQYDANNILVQRDTIRLTGGGPDKFHTNILATAPYDPLLPLSGWVAPSSPIAGNTVEVKFSDGTVVNYTWDGTDWVLDFDTPTYILKGCDNVDLPKNAKVHQVTNLTRQTGFGVVKLDGVDCLGHDDDYYNSTLNNYTANRSLNPTNLGPKSRILNGNNNSIATAGDWSIVGGTSSSSQDFLQNIYGEGNVGFAGAYYSTISGGNINKVYSPYSYIGTASNSTINNLSNYGTIINGNGNNITNSIGAAIISGFQSNITNSTFAYIGATKLSDITDAPYSSIIGGLNQEINNSPYSAIFSGDNNLIKNGYNGNNFILNGTLNNILNIGSSSSLSGTFAPNALSAFSHIENGRLNVISAGFSSSNGFENINTALGTKTHGVYLKANNTYSTIFGVNNVTRIPSPILGEMDFYRNNEDLFVISNGSNLGVKEVGESNSFIHKKNGWTQINTGVQLPKTDLQTTPIAALHVETRDFTGGASSGALLAPMTLAERNNIPLANLVDGLEIYCTDCIASDGSTGVKQVYQASISTWRNLYDTEIITYAPTQSMYAGYNVASYPISANTAIGNTIFGYNALNNLDANSQGDNTAFGLNVLKNLTTGNSNVAVGADNMIVATTASHNTAIGDFALGAIQTGNYNVGVGSQSLRSVTTSNDNTAIGAWSGSNITTGGFNVAVGANALEANTTSNQNVAVGATALKSAISADNTALGTSAGFSVTTGQRNILIGSNAATALTTGSNNIVLGYNVDLPTTSTTNALKIGNAIYGTDIYTDVKVGISEIAPEQKLHVNGKIKVGDDSNTPTVGTIRYNSTTDKFQGYTTTGWVDLH